MSIIGDARDEQLEVRLKELKSDERMYYPTASVFINAPLALIQTDIGARINLLEELLGIPISKFPLKR